MSEPATCLSENRMEVVHDASPLALGPTGVELSASLPFITISSSNQLDTYKDGQTLTASIFAFFAAWSVIVYSVHCTNGQGQQSGNP